MKPNIIKQIYYARKHKFQIRCAFLCDIDLSKLDESIVITHPIGIVIGKSENIGKRCIIRHNVTIGRRHYDSQDYPVIEDDVIIGCGAVILGNVRVYSGANIGAGSVILKDVPSGVTAVGIWK